MITFVVTWCLEPPRSIPGSIWWNFKNVKFRSYWIDLRWFEKCHIFVMCVIFSDILRTYKIWLFSMSGRDWVAPRDGFWCYTMSITSPKWSWIDLNIFFKSHIFVMGVIFFWYFENLKSDLSAYKEGLEWPPRDGFWCCLMSRTSPQVILDRFGLIWNISYFRH